MALFSRPKPPAELEIVGVERPLFGDVYHALIRAPWWKALLLFAVVWCAMNLLFAGLYHVTGGVQGAKSIVDLFFFSVQTSGTIGYGSMYPVSDAAHVVVAIESMISVVLVALTTGLAFAKFSMPRARVQFVNNPTIAPYDGVPTLMMRLGHMRDTRLIEATVRVVCIRTERNREGVTYYRMYDLQLERERSPAMSRSWTIMHVLRPGSPLHGATPESLARDEVELVVTLTGIDEVSAQQLHAQKQYDASAIKWGMRHVDLITPLADGRLRVDLSRFHDVVATEPTAEFPYPAR